MYYFYMLDPEFGPGFIKICTYVPYPAKVWLNGHEWAKRQAARAGIPFTRAVQRVRELRSARAAAGDLRHASAPSMCRRSSTAGSPQIPTPLSADDRAAGYWWELSMRQVEIVPHARVRRPAPRPLLLRSACSADNIGIGRPEEVSLVFARRSRPTQHPFRTRIFTAGTEVRIDFRYKHSRVKQYLKDGRALRIETVINKPSDLDVLARLAPPPRADRQSPRRSTSGCL